MTAHELRELLGRSPEAREIFNAGTKVGRTAGHRQGRREGFALGYQEGFADGAADAQAAPAPVAASSSRAVARAERFLADLLGDHQPRPVPDVLAAAEAAGVAVDRSGASPRPGSRLKVAKRRAGIQVRQARGAWWWWLPPEGAGPDEFWDWIPH